MAVSGDGKQWSYAALWKNSGYATACFQLHSAVRVSGFVTVALTVSLVVLSDAVWQWMTLIVWPGYRPKRTAFRRILAGDVTRLQSVQHRIMNWMRASLQPHATRTVYCIGSPIYKLCKRHSNAITDRKWDGCWVTPCICSPQLVFAETYLLFACQNLRCAY